MVYWNIERSGERWGRTTVLQVVLGHETPWMSYSLSTPPPCVSAIPPPTLGQAHFPPRSAPSSSSFFFLSLLSQAPFPPELQRHVPSQPRGAQDSIIRALTPEGRPWLIRGSCLAPRILRMLREVAQDGANTFLWYWLRQLCTTENAFFPGCRDLSRPASVAA